MPHVSTEAIIGAALVVVLAFGYQYLPKATSTSAEGSSSASKKNKKKNKKRKAGGEVGSSLNVSEVDSDAPKVTAAPSTAAGKKGKAKAQDASTPAADKSAPALAAPAPVAPSPVPAVKEPLTREAPSFAAVAGGSDEAPRPSKQRTLAEKLVAKPRKTKVDDMLEPEDRAPQLARVMKITSGSGTSSPARAPSVRTSSSEKLPKFADDYAEVDSDSDSEASVEEDEWNVVPTKKKPVSLSIGSGSSSSAAHRSSDSMTKIQKKNAKKAEAKKAMKAADEADRQRRLAAHKRTLEREKINEIYSQQQKVTKQHGKVVSGGQSASVNTKGQLVWD